MHSRRGGVKNPENFVYVLIRSPLIKQPTQLFVLPMHMHVIYGDFLLTMVFLAFSGGPAGEPAGPDDGGPREPERFQHVLRRLRARPRVRIRVNIRAQLIQVRLKTSILYLQLFF